MNLVYEKLMNCYHCVREKIDFVPRVAIVLGSGLGDLQIKLTWLLSCLMIRLIIFLFPPYRDMPVNLFSDMLETYRWFA